VSGCVHEFRFPDHANATVEIQTEADEEMEEIGVHARVVEAIAREFAND